MLFRSTPACVACGVSLTLGAGAPVAMKAASSERPCPNCGTMVPEQNKFCGSCGKPTGASEVVRAPGGRQAPKTMFFSVMQAPGRAKLILIKGDGYDGMSYVLSATEHTAGRTDGDITFPDDSLLSPRHANFFYKEGRLHVRDEQSTNGVFVRIIKPQRLRSGSTFLIGEQLMRLDACLPDAAPAPDPDGTYFYTSPRRPARFVLTQLLVGGASGMIFRARNDSIGIGREGNDVNFPDDPFISGRHAQVTTIEPTHPEGEALFELHDLGSKNGTFLRVQGEAALNHGDYVFIGQQLLRVEVT